MEFSANITKRTRRRVLADGTVVMQDRFVLNFRDPKSRARRQEFFEKRAEAEARYRELLVAVSENAYVNRREVAKIAAAVDHWLADRKPNVKASTYRSYEAVCRVIRGPLLLAGKQDRAAYTMTGEKPKGAKSLPMLGHMKLSDLTTADIRAWHRSVVDHCGHYTANRALAHLRSVLALAEEDFGVRAPSMPTHLAKRRHKPKKAILTPAEISRIIEAAREDRAYGIYYAFPFLAGTRPSEQLGLLWEDVDFAAGLIHIRRVQERDGSLTDMTKTEAGTRLIPMGALLREMLLAWRLQCPRKDGELHRVFPGPGRLQPWPLPRKGGGGALLYQNYRRRYWEPAFKALGLPYVTPHSARHSFISTLQAQGIEVGLVAKIAGHANPAVTLGHYTQAVRGADSAAAALERAYGTV